MLLLRAVKFKQQNDDTIAILLAIGVECVHSHNVLYDTDHTNNFRNSRYV